MSLETNTHQNKANASGSSELNKGKEAGRTYLFCYEADKTQILIEQGIKMEVLETTTIYPVPNVPKWYSGITSLRGETLIVVNIHYLLGSFGTLNIKNNNTKKRLLKLEHPDFPPLAIAIDNLPYQMDVGRLTTDPNFEKKQYPRWIKSSASYNKQIFLVVDHSTLFRTMQENTTL